MVYHKAVQRCITPGIHRVLQAGKSAFCILYPHHVCHPFTLPLWSDVRLTIRSVVYAAEAGLSIHSCFLTPVEKDERRESKEEKETMKVYEDVVLNSPSMIPMSAGLGPAAAQQPGTTPRTLAFNRLGGDSPKLPLRDYPQEADESAQNPAYYPPPPRRESKG